MRGRYRLLLVCGALASGEFLAAHVPLASGSWPFFLFAAVLAALFGYGLGLPGWLPSVAFLLGIALYFGAAEEKVGRQRMSPWRCERMTGRWQPGRGGDAASRIRLDLSRRLALGLSEGDEALDLARAVILGERDGLSRRMKRTFVESGTLHVFAISGLHVMAVANVLSFLLAVLLVPRRFCGLLSVPLLWGYVTVIGAPPSAVRAALMASFSLTAPLFWRRPSGLRSWCLTFLAVHLANPILVDHVGNALSFVVMLAIVLTGEMSAGLPRWQGTLLVTLAAWAAGLPISAHVFGRVTPGSMLANLVLIGMAQFSVQVGVVGLAASYCSASLAAHLNNLTAFGLRLMAGLSGAVARLPFSNFETGCWGYATCAGWYLALVLCAFLLFRRGVRRRMV